MIIMRIRHTQTRKDLHQGYGVVYVDVASLMVLFTYEQHIAATYQSYLKIAGPIWVFAVHTLLDFVCFWTLYLIMYRRVNYLANPEFYK